MMCSIDRAAMGVVIASGVNTYGGKLTSANVAEVHGYERTDIHERIGEAAGRREDYYQNEH